MPIVVREFNRSDRDQLTALVNLHVSSVLPGVARSLQRRLQRLGARQTGGFTRLQRTPP